jgi:hypothetical protein
MILSLSSKNAAVKNNIPTIKIRIEKQAETHPDNELVIIAQLDMGTGCFLHNKRV